MKTDDWRFIHDGVRLQRVCEALGCMFGTDGVDIVNAYPEPRSMMRKVRAAVGARAALMAEVSTERDAQDAKWGEQNHPMVWRTRPPDARYCGAAACHEHGLPSAHAAKESCDAATAEGTLTWADILVEEVAEAVEAAAIHGDTSDELRAELVQCAAVVVAMIECIDRKRAAKGDPLPDGE